MAEAEWKQLFQEPPKVTAESQIIKEKMATALTFARICFRYGANGMSKVVDSSVVDWERIALPVSKILQKERNQVETLAKDAEIQAAIDYILENGWFNTCEDLAMVAKYELTSVQKMALTQVILKTNELKSPPNISVAPAHTGIDETAILERFVFDSILRLDKKRSSAMLIYGCDLWNGMEKLEEFPWPDESERKLPDTMTTLASKKEVAGQLKEVGGQKTVVSNKEEATGATGKKKGVSDQTNSRSKLPDKMTKLASKEVAAQPKEGGGRKTVVSNKEEATGATGPVLARKERDVAGPSFQSSEDVPRKLRSYK